MFGDKKKVANRVRVREKKGALLHCHNVIPNLTTIFDGVNSAPPVHKGSRLFYLFNKRENHYTLQTKFTSDGQRVCVGAQLCLRRNVLITLTSEGC